LEPSGNATVHTHTPQQWLDSDFPKQVRETLSRDEWPDACSRCRLDEAAGLPSMRLRPETFGPGISHVDLRFGNSCNLRCIMCQPGSSSSLVYEHQEMLEKGLESPWNSWNEIKVMNWYDSDKAEMIAGLADLKEIYLTGGEPMMVKNLSQFLSMLDPNVVLRFNTNGTVINPSILDQLKRFKSVNIAFSIDGVGRVNDYIRFGSRWADIEENIKHYSDVADISISPTVQILNVLYYDDLLSWAADNNCKVYESPLLNPSWLSIKNAPDSIKEKIKYFKEWSNDPADIQCFDLFRKHITALDKNRNISISDYLPEVAAAYGIN
jgi:sulfatase maturation enzyme AslB (radical SAM superfamily)